LTNQLAESPSPLVLPSNDSFLDENVLIFEIKTCKIYFDGSKCRNSSNVGGIIVLPFRKLILLSYCLNFLCTKKTVEYEELLVGLHFTLIIGAQDIKIINDSKLVIKIIKIN
jgi:ribonuclease HI